MGERLSFWQRLKQPHIDFVASVAVIALIAGFFFYPEMREKTFWTGDRGWLEVLAPIGTVAAATIAAWLAWRNYLLGQQKESSERFESGVALFESEGHSQKAAGIIILEELALTEPDGRRASWVREFIVHAINEWNQALLEPIARPIVADDFERTPEVTLRALLAYSRIRSMDPANFRSLFISKCVIGKQKWQGIRALDCLLYDADFMQTDLKECWFIGPAFGSNSWEDCDIVGGRMRFSRESSADIHIRDCDLSRSNFIFFGDADATIERCKLDGAKISGTARVELVDCWFDTIAPEVRNINALGGAALGLYRSNGRTDGVTPRGMPTWKKRADDVPVVKADVAPPEVLRRLM